jgi:hypothetical protein
MLCSMLAKVRTFCLSIVFGAFLFSGVGTAQLFCDGSCAVMAQPTGGAPFLWSYTPDPLDRPGTCRRDCVNESCVITGTIACANLWSVPLALSVNGVHLTVLPGGGFWSVDINTVAPGCGNSVTFTASSGGGYSNSFIVGCWWCVVHTA